MAGTGNLDAKRWICHWLASLETDLHLGRRLRILELVRDVVIAGAWPINGLVVDDVSHNTPPQQVQQPCG
jgi:hypothetical protein